MDLAKWSVIGTSTKPVDANTSKQFLLRSSRKSLKIKIKSNANRNVTKNTWNRVTLSLLGIWVPEMPEGIKHLAIGNSISHPGSTCPTSPVRSSQRFCKRKMQNMQIDTYKNKHVNTWQFKNGQHCLGIFGNWQSYTIISNFSSILVALLNFAQDVKAKGMCKVPIRAERSAFLTWTKRKRGMMSIESTDSNAECPLCGTRNSSCFLHSFHLSSFFSFQSCQSLWCEKKQWRFLRLQTLTGLRDLPFGFSRSHAISIRALLDVIIMLLPQGCYPKITPDPLSLGSNFGLGIKAPPPC